MGRLSAALIAVVATVAFTQIAGGADLPVKAPVAVAAPEYNWTGFYFGANVGGGWGSRDVGYSPNDPMTAELFSIGGVPPSASLNSSGALGGLQLGYNRQLNRNWLIGLEADFDWSGMKGSDSTGGFILGSAVLVPRPFTATADERIKWFGTVRARLGYLPTDNVLAYVTGGFAYGQVEHTGNYAIAVATAGNNSGFSFSCTAGTTCFTGSSSGVVGGWTLGAGIEYAFWQRWTVKAEYLYVSLDSNSVTETALALSIPGTTPASFDANYSRTNFNLARVGLNYRF